MKITKRQLRRIIREERARLLREEDPFDADRRAWKGEPDMDVVEAADELYTALKTLTRLGVEALSDDELYIMTGEPEGITVKVLRRGR
ncbi:MAG: hypothetical protein CMB52_05365 [Euryarchaeota archaeon]|nr:hypothetical protein [Euryarchaeota archaeon]MBJ84925.1 hypothetical protein [Euryarchaeota archaeon]|tara:strand:- start:1399 stop:1662 length:264 start_codon:yes stop_codon:yes gene_type:complete